MQGYGLDRRVGLITRADGATPRNLSGKVTAKPILWREMHLHPPKGKAATAVMLSGKRTEGEYVDFGVF